MFKVCLLLLCISTVVYGLLMFEKVNETSRCLLAMCKEDSGCVPIGCDVDVYGRVGCGYFRLNIYQYQQCWLPGKENGESEENGWMRCAHDYECSSTCIKTVAAKFRVKCYGKSDCETIARIHDGGANGCRDPRTVEYWEKVKGSCGNNCTKIPIFTRH